MSETVRHYNSMIAYPENLTNEREKIALAEANKHIPTSEIAQDIADAESSSSSRRALPHPLDSSF
jgi:hypothetical protein